MSRRRHAGWAPLLVAMALIALSLSRCGTSGGGSAEPSGPVSARVTHVVDGDTIDVSIDGDDDTVRYIGIDTPETVKPGTPVQCGGPRAHEVNDRLVYGKTVTLRFDAERRDVYGRLLAYVYLPRAGRRPLFVNAELARRGLARPLTIPPNDSFAALFDRLATRAGVRGWGLWGSCPL
jgi:micrococcal nuclease